MLYSTDRERLGGGYILRSLIISEKLVAFNNEGLINRIKQQSTAAGTENSSKPEHFWGTLGSWLLFPFGNQTVPPGYSTHSKLQPCNGNLRKRSAMRSYTLLDV